MHNDDVNTLGRLAGGPYLYDAPIAGVEQLEERSGWSPTPLAGIRWISTIPCVDCGARDRAGFLPMTWSICLVCRSAR